MIMQFQKFDVFLSEYMYFREQFVKKTLIYERYFSAKLLVAIQITYDAKNRTIVQNIFVISASGS